jgi:hypothetical protein
MEIQNTGKLKGSPLAVAHVKHRNESQKLDASIFLNLNIYPLCIQNICIHTHMSILVQAPTQSASCCKYAFPDFHPVQAPTQSAHRQARQEICPATSRSAQPLHTVSIHTSTQNSPNQNKNSHFFYSLVFIVCLWNDPLAFFFTPWFLLFASGMTQSSPRKAHQKRTEGKCALRFPPGKIT